MRRHWTTSKALASEPFVLERALRNHYAGQFSVLLRPGNWHGIQRVLRINEYNPHSAGLFGMLGLYNPLNIPVEDEDYHAGDIVRQRCACIRRLRECAGERSARQEDVGAGAVFVASCLAVGGGCTHVRPHWLCRGAVILSGRELPLREIRPHRVDVHLRVQHQHETKGSRTFTLMVVKGADSLGCRRVEASAGSMRRSAVPSLETLQRKEKKK